MENIVQFKVAQFNKIFPFYILINSDLIIVSVGKTMEKLYPNSVGKKFLESFEIERPHLNNESIDSFKLLVDQTIIVNCLNESKTKLRGQLELLEDQDEIIFLVSPWFDSMEMVTEHNLSLKDFAFHDPIIDLLHLLKTQELTTEDLKHLLNTVNKQKDELKQANQEIKEIALFPTQNPDPLIRINLKGEIIRQNPAAEKLASFIYDQKEYTSTEFWKKISSTLNIDEERIIIEAQNEREYYSFVIIPLPDSGYFNIYGRKVTEEKLNEQQLEILSSIAAQNTHGVVIADKEGNVEWANKSFETMTGFGLEEIKGKKPGHFLQGPDSDPETIKYLKTQIAKGEPFSCEILNYNKLKEPYWLRIQGQALHDKAGNIIKYFAIEEDITTERENQQKIQEFEKRFRTALEKIGDYVWEYNFIDEKIRFSKDDNIFTGENDINEDSLSKLWTNHIFEEDREKYINNIAKYKSGDIDNHKLEYRVKDKDGNLRWVLDRGVIIEMDAFGEPLLSIGTHTDITKQKSLEIDLKTTATRLTSLIQNLYSGVLLENENRKIMLINQKFCDHFEIPANPEDLIGVDCTSAAEQSKHLFLHQDKFVTRIDQILKEKKIVVNEHLEMKNGKHLQRDFIPIWNDGIYSGHLWLYTDITEQINAEKKLEDQKIFYEQILNNIPADIAVLDKQQRYVFLNPKAVENPEIRSWLIGKKDDDYAKLKNLSLDIVNERKKHFNTAVKSNKLHSFEEKIIRPDGSSKYVLRNFYPIQNEDGEVQLVVGYGIDITNIKEIQHKIEASEKRFRDVFENSLALITTHDLNGKLLSVNPMVSKSYGYEDEEMVGHNVKEFIPDSEKKLFETRYLKNILEKKQDKGLIRIKSKSGKIIYTLYNNFLKEEPGKDPYIIGFGVDITERVQAEKELKLAKKTTEELAAAKQNFLANMSHEIRTPMNAIFGMTNQLKKTDLQKNQNFYVNTIATATESLLVIIDDILDLSKIEAGKLSLENIAFSPQKVVKSTINVMLHKAEEKGIQLTNTFYDPSISDVLIGDPHRLNQVLLNLLSNAIKFTEKGSVDIKCRVIEDNPDSQTLRAEITDTGIGMDGEFAKNLFSKFNQEDASISRKYGGTGLGMTITRSLIELMNGKMSVTSKKNVGTTVRFELKFKKGKIEELPVIEDESVDAFRIAGKKILVVDDNEMNRLVASTVLKNYDIEIIEAENGVQAIELTKTCNPDLILMDLQMPKLSGIEATKEIRKSGNQIPIIALTANAIKGENENCFAAGMNDYLSKPFKENELIYKINNLIGHTPTKEETSILENIKDTPKISEEKLYNLKGLEEISSGNQEFIKKMIGMFCSQTPEIVNEMIAAYKSKNYTQMGALAHKMKPSIDNLRIELIKQDVRIIEKQGKENNISDETESILNKINSTIQSTIESMKREFPDL